MGCELLNCGLLNVDCELLNCGLLNVDSGYGLWIVNLL